MYIYGMEQIVSHPFIKILLPYEGFERLAAFSEEPRSCEASSIPMENDLFLFAR